MGSSIMMEADFGPSNGMQGQDDRVVEAAMAVQMTLQGTVRGDGSLELDDRIAMPEGRVLVTVRPIAQPASDDPFWQRMEQIWAGQRARGHAPRTKEQIDAELRELRDDAEVEMRATERLHGECRGERRDVPAPQEPTP
jgi:hypothetical protein